MDNNEVCKKKKFLDLKTAHASLKKIHGLMFRREFTPIRAYKCEICSNGSRPIYHLTHHDRAHWMINLDFRIPGKPANPDIIESRIQELTKIVEQKKREEENERGMENGSKHRGDVRGKQSGKPKKGRGRH